MSLIIAIDYDFTFTADVVLFTEFIFSAQKAGHTVVCVTSRYRPPESPEPFLPAGVEIICARGLSKEDAARSAGYKVDIWIDDMPRTITES